jgi:hypothetical protein
VVVQLFRRPTPASSYEIPFIGDLQPDLLSARIRVNGRTVWRYRRVRVCADSLALV